MTYLRAAAPNLANDVDYQPDTPCLEHRPGSGLPPAASCYPGNSSVLTGNTCFEIIADVGPLLKMIVIDFLYLSETLQMLRVKSKCIFQHGRRRKRRLRAKPLDTTRHIGRSRRKGSLNLELGQRLQNLSSFSISLWVDMQRLPLLRYIGQESKFRSLLDL